MPSMKRYFKYKYAFIAFSVILGLTSCIKNHTSRPEVSLKEAFSGKFYMGVAMDSAQIIGIDTAGIRIIKQHFNSVVAENCMKSEVIQPKEGEFNFTLADQFVNFGEKNDMFTIGHVLIWHSQAPAWFFTDKNGKDVSREVLIQRMKTHISTLVGRYKGKVKSWDVVNEAINDDGSWRENKFYQIIGKEYVKLAFQFAYEADSSADLIYNDYSMALPGRREGVVKMVKELQQQGIKITGIGMQCHIHLNSPPVDEFEKSLVAFAELGVKVMITEMDISVLPTLNTNDGADISTNYQYDKSLNPYSDKLSDSVATALANRYISFFKLFLKHQDKISRVTVWGVNDSQSWLNNWPVHGRTDYPLLFDRNFKPKPFVQTIIQDALNSKTK